MAVSEGGGPAPGIREAVRDFVAARLRHPVVALQVAAADLSREGASRYGDTHHADLERIAHAASLLDGLTERLAEPGDGDPRTLSVRKIRHDLRTPITAILGYGELVQEEAEDAGDAWLVGATTAILRDATTLLASIDELASLARPSKADAATLQPPPSVSAGEGAGETTPGIVGRILVVDDNPAILDLVTRRIARHGHAVTSCDNGEAALALTETAAFDLVMLDLLMPGMSGLEVLTLLKARPSSQGIPVIVMSALDEIESAVRCIEAGADDYLSKPLDETLLRARIGSSLERKFLRDREQETLAQLQAEQQRSDALLHNILPVSIVRRLRAGETLIADHLEDVTVLFSDLVGFTALSSKLEAAGTLKLLEEIFSGFDALAEEYDVEKIKTIGDAYMVVGGIADPGAGTARRVAAMACRMAGIVKSSQHGEALDIRIGIDTGPAAGGIIGTKKFFYDVWGDTVNTASRLEASCQPGRIHISAETRAVLGDAHVYEDRGPIPIHGKGMMRTFYVLP